jgi:hypothetical protein
VSVQPDLSPLDVSFVRVEPLVTRRIAIDDSGTGTITGVVPGHYVLMARGLAGGRTWAASDVVDFVGDTQEILLQMRPASRVVGRVTGEKGAAIRFDGVRVGATLMQDGVEINPLDIDEAPVAADGTFSLDGLFGTRKLQVMGLDPEWEIRAVMQDRADVTAAGVALTDDTEAKVVIVVGRR